MNSTWLQRARVFFFGIPRNRRGKQLHRLLAVNHEVRMF